MQRNVVHPWHMETMAVFVCLVRDILKYTSSRAHSHSFLCTSSTDGTGKEFIYVCVCAESEEGERGAIQTQA